MRKQPMSPGAPPIEGLTNPTVDTISAITKSPTPPCSNVDDTTPQSYAPDDSLHAFSLRRSQRSRRPPTIFRAETGGSTSVPALSTTLSNTFASNTTPLLGPNPNLSLLSALARGPHASSNPADVLPAHGLHGLPPSLKPTLSSLPLLSSSALFPSRMPTSSASLFSQTPSSSLPAGLHALLPAHPAPSSSSLPSISTSTTPTTTTANANATATALVALMSAASAGAPTTHTTSTTIASASTTVAEAALDAATDTPRAKPVARARGRPRRQLPTTANDMPALSTTVTAATTSAPDATISPATAANASVVAEEATSSRKKRKFIEKSSRNIPLGHSGDPDGAVTEDSSMAGAGSRRGRGGGRGRAPGRGRGRAAGGQGGEERIEAKPVEQSGGEASARVLDAPVVVGGPEAERAGEKSVEQARRREGDVQREAGAGRRERDEEGEEDDDDDDDDPGSDDDEEEEYRRMYVSSSSFSSSSSSSGLRIRHYTLIRHPFELRDKVHCFTGLKRVMTLGWRVSRMMVQWDSARTRVEREVARWRRSAREQDKERQREMARERQREARRAEERMAEVRRDGSQGTVRTRGKKRKTDMMDEGHEREIQPEITQIPGEGSLADVQEGIIPAVPPVAEAQNTEIIPNISSSHDNPVTISAASDNHVQLSPHIGNANERTGLVFDASSEFQEIELLTRNDPFFSQLSPMERRWALGLHLSSTTHTHTRARPDPSPAHTLPSYSPLSMASLLSVPPLPWHLRSRAGSMRVGALSQHDHVPVPMSAPTTTPPPPVAYTPSMVLHAPTTASLTAVHACSVGVVCDSYRDHLAVYCRDVLDHRQVPPATDAAAAAQACAGTDACVGVDAAAPREGGEAGMGALSVAAGGVQCMGAAHTSHTLATLAAADTTSSSTAVSASGVLPVHLYGADAVGGEDDNTLGKAGSGKGKPGVQGPRKVGRPFKVKRGPPSKAERERRAREAQERQEREERERVDRERAEEESGEQGGAPTGPSSISTSTSPSLPVLPPPLLLSSLSSHYMHLRVSPLTLLRYLASTMHTQPVSVPSYETVVAQLIHPAAAHDDNSYGSTGDVSGVDSNNSRASPPPVSDPPSLLLLLLSSASPLPCLSLSALALAPPLLPVFLPSLTATRADVLLFLTPRKAAHARRRLCARGLYLDTSPNTHTGAWLSNVVGVGIDAVSPFAVEAFTYHNMCASLLEALTALKPSGEMLVGEEHALLPHDDNVSSTPTMVTNLTTKRTKHLPPVSAEMKDLFNLGELHEVIHKNAYTRKNRSDFSKDSQKHRKTLEAEKQDQNTRDSGVHGEVSNAGEENENQSGKESSRKIKTHQEKEAPKEDPSFRHGARHRPTEALNGVLSSRFTTWLPTVGVHTPHALWYTRVADMARAPRNAWEFLTLTPISRPCVSVDVLGMRQAEIERGSAEGKKKKRDGTEWPMDPAMSWIQGPESWKIPEISKISEKDSITQALSLMLLSVSESLRYVCSFTPYSAHTRARLRAHRWMRGTDERGGGGEPGGGVGVRSCTHDAEPHKVTREDDSGRGGVYSGVSNGAAASAGGTRADVHVAGDGVDRAGLDVEVEGVCSGVVAVDENHTHHARDVDPSRGVPSAASRESAYGAVDDDAVSIASLASLASHASDVSIASAISDHSQVSQQSDLSAASINSVASHSSLASHASIISHASHTSTASTASITSISSQASPSTLPPLSSSSLPLSQLSSSSLSSSRMESPHYLNHGAVWTEALPSPLLPSPPPSLAPLALSSLSLTPTPLPRLPYPAAPHRINTSPFHHFLALHAPLCTSLAILLGCGTHTAPLYLRDVAAPAVLAAWRARVDMAGRVVVVVADGGAGDGVGHSDGGCASDVNVHVDASEQSMHAHTHAHKRYDSNEHTSCPGPSSPSSSPPALDTLPCVCVDVCRLLGLPPLQGYSAHPLDMVRGALTAAEHVLRRGARRTGKEEKGAEQQEEGSENADMRNDKLSSSSSPPSASAPALTSKSTSTRHVAVLPQPPAAPVDGLLARLGLPAVLIDSLCMCKRLGTLGLGPHADLFYRLIGGEVKVGVRIGTGARRGGEQVEDSEGCGCRGEAPVMRVDDSVVFITRPLAAAVAPHTDTRAAPPLASATSSSSCSSCSRPSAPPCPPPPPGLPLSATLTVLANTPVLDIKQHSLASFPHSHTHPTSRPRATADPSSLMHHLLLHSLPSLAHAHLSVHPYHILHIAALLYLSLPSPARAPAVELASAASQGFTGRLARELCVPVMDAEAVFAVAQGQFDVLMPSAYEAFADARRCARADGNSDAAGDRGGDSQRGGDEEQDQETRTEQREGNTDHAARHNLESGTGTFSNSSSSCSDNGAREGRAGKPNAEGEERCARDGATGEGALKGGSGDTMVAPPTSAAPPSSPSLPLSALPLSAVRAPLLAALHAWPGTNTHRPADPTTTPTHTRTPVRTLACASTHPSPNPSSTLVHTHAMPQQHTATTAPSPSPRIVCSPFPAAPTLTRGLLWPQLCVLAERMWRPLPTHTLAHGEMSRYVDLPPLPLAPAAPTPTPSRPLNRCPGAPPPPTLHPSSSLSALHTALLALPPSSSAWLAVASRLGISLPLLPARLSLHLQHWIRDATSTLPGASTAATAAKHASQEHETPSEHSGADVTSRSFATFLTPMLPPSMLSSLTAVSLSHSLCLRHSLFHTACLTSLVAHARVLGLFPAPAHAHPPSLAALTFRAPPPPLPHPLTRLHASPHVLHILPLLAVDARTAMLPRPHTAQARSQQNRLYREYVVAMARAGEAVASWALLGRQAQLQSGLEGERQSTGAAYVRRRTRRGADRDADDGIEEIEDVCGVGEGEDAVADVVDVCPSGDGPRAKGSTNSSVDGSGGMHTRTAHTTSSTTTTTAPLQPAPLCSPPLDAAQLDVLLSSGGQDMPDSANATDSQTATTNAATATSIATAPARFDSAAVASTCVNLPRVPVLSLAPALLSSRSQYDSLTCGLHQSSGGGGGGGEDDVFYVAAAVSLPAFHDNTPLDSEAARIAREEAERVRVRLRLPPIGHEDEEEEAEEEARASGRERVAWRKRESGKEEEGKRREDEDDDVSVVSVSSDDDNNDNYDGNDGDNFYDMHLSDDIDIDSVCSSNDNAVRVSRHSFINIDDDDMNNDYNVDGDDDNSDQSSRHPHGSYSDDEGMSDRHHRGARRAHRPRTSKASGEHDDTTNRKRSDLTGHRGGPDSPFALASTLVPALTHVLDDAGSRDAAAALDAMSVVSGVSIASAASYASAHAPADAGTNAEAGAGSSASSPSAALAKMRASTPASVVDVAAVGVTALCRTASTASDASRGSDVSCVSAVSHTSHVSAVSIASIASIASVTSGGSVASAVSHMSVASHASIASTVPIPACATEEMPVSTSTSNSGYTAGGECGAVAADIGASVRHRSAAVDGTQRGGGYHSAEDSDCLITSEDDDNSDNDDDNDDDTDGVSSAPSLMPSCSSPALSRNVNALAVMLSHLNALLRVSATHTHTHGAAAPSCAAHATSRASSRPSAADVATPACSALSSSPSLSSVSEDIVDLDADLASMTQRAPVEASARVRTSAWSTAGHGAVAGTKIASTSTTCMIGTDVSTPRPPAYAYRIALNAGYYWVSPALISAARQQRAMLLQLPGVDEHTRRRLRKAMRNVRVGGRSGVVRAHAHRASARRALQRERERERWISVGGNGGVINMHMPSLFGARTAHVGTGMGTNMSSGVGMGAGSSGVHGMGGDRTAFNAAVPAAAGINAGGAARAGMGMGVNMGTGMSSGPAGDEWWRPSVPTNRKRHHGHTSGVHPHTYAPAYTHAQIHGQAHLLGQEQGKAMQGNITTQVYTLQQQLQIQQQAPTHLHPQGRQHVGHIAHGTHANVTHTAQGNAQHYPGQRPAPEGLHRGIDASMNTGVSPSMGVGTDVTVMLDTELPTNTTDNDIIRNNSRNAPDLFELPIDIPNTVSLGMGPVPSVPASTLPPEPHGAKDMSLYARPTYSHAYARGQTPSRELGGVGENGDAGKNAGTAVDVASPPRKRARTTTTITTAATTAAPSTAVAIAATPGTTTVASGVAASSDAPAISIAPPAPAAHTAAGVSSLSRAPSSFSLPHALLSSVATSPRHPAHPLPRANVRTHAAAAASASANFASLLSASASFTYTVLPSTSFPSASFSSASFSSSSPRPTPLIAATATAAGTIAAGSVPPGTAEAAVPAPVPMDTVAIATTTPLTAATMAVGMDTGPNTDTRVSVAPPASPLSRIPSLVPSPWASRSPLPRTFSSPRPLSPLRSLSSARPLSPHHLPSTHPLSPQRLPSTHLLAPHRPLSPEHMQSSTNTLPHLRPHSPPAPSRLSSTPRGAALSPPPGTTTATTMVHTSPLSPTAVGTPRSPHTITRPHTPRTAWPRSPHAATASRMARSLSSSLAAATNTATKPAPALAPTFTAALNTTTSTILPAPLPPGPASASTAPSTSSHKRLSDMSLVELRTIVLVRMPPDARASLDMALRVRGVSAREVAAATDATLKQWNIASARVREAVLRVLDQFR